MNLPVSYDHLNAYNAAFKPSTMHCSDTGLRRFFEKYLLQEAISVFRWELPELWDRDYFLYSLFYFGRCAVINTDRFGVIPQFCGLRGYDVFYRPTNAVITNPLLKGILDPEIGKDCTVFRLNADFSGLMDIVTFYADQMALCAQTAGINTMNSKLSYVFFAKNKAAAESWKKMADKILSGEPIAVVDKELQNEAGGDAWKLFQQNVRNNYIAGDLLQDLRKWEQMFLTAVGIPNANTEKKERLISDEVAANNVEVCSNAAMWLERLQRVAEQTNKMFNLNITVDWRWSNGDVDYSGSVQMGSEAV